jgi:hypothetical protein
MLSVILLGTLGAALLRDTTTRNEFPLTLWTKNLSEQMQHLYTVWRYVRQERERSRMYPEGPMILGKIEENT